MRRVAFFLTVFSGISPLFCRSVISLDVIRGEGFFVLRLIGKSE